MLACGAGILDAVQVLVERNTDVHLASHKGKGIAQLAKKSSPSVAQWLQENTGAQSTHSRSPGRASGDHESQARQVRHMTSTSSYWRDWHHWHAQGGWWGDRWGGHWDGGWSWR